MWKADIPCTEENIRWAIIVMAVHRVSTSIHYHGFFQRGTNWYDGVPEQSQCPIPNNTTFIYNFTVPDQSGTFWYHSHHLAHKGLEPRPDNGLINGRNNYNCKWAPVSYKCIDDVGLSKFNFVPGKRYRLRVINTSALLSFHFQLMNMQWIGVVNGSTCAVDVDNPTINQILLKNQTLFQPNQNVIGQFNTSQVIDIVVYNGVTGEHPFHLHGHTFWVLGSGPVDTKPDFSKLNIFDPIKRDTATISPEEWIVIRFEANNPGIWAFHCHIEWHVEAGLVAQFIELPHELRKLKPPSNWEQLCIKSPNPYNDLILQSEQRTIIDDMRNVDTLIKILVGIGENWNLIGIIC
ncbi:multicopper oxidase [Gigaspora margarita]|uniref:Multicopper oxidase n=1 Tax=Gigaspora margarita TaxID=4874 RepID=A0A8H3XHZ2_GIGMA|nr:multicopper oxidase [Gigaspora margarita]